MQAKTILEAFFTLDHVEGTGSRNAKIAILEAHKDNEALQWLLYWAYGPEKYFVYPSEGWRAHSPTISYDPTNKQALSNWNKFTKLLERLRDRVVTGHAAQAEVDQFFAGCANHEIQWYGRAMSHDLKSGFSQSTINKVWDPKFFWSGGSSNSKSLVSDNVAYPGTMLCAKYAGWDGLGTRFVEPKLDGYRLCLVMYNGEYSFYTRSGHCDPYNKNLKYIVDQLHAAGVDNVMLDGEVMHEDWNKTGLIKRKTPSAAQQQEIKEKIVFYVFDMIDWNTETGHKVTLEDRKAKLIKLLDADVPSDYSKFCELIMDGQLTTVFSYSTKINGVRMGAWADVDNETELNEYYAKCLAQGFEGVVIKDPIGQYKYSGSRTNSWMKHKPLTTVDAQIVGFENGTSGTKNAKRLGAMVVRTPEGLQFKVGIGFKDFERDEYWDKRDAMMGQWIEAKYQSDTVADGRFGRFIRLREDLNG